jgi:twitching motility two-component system response regulator PilG
VLQEGIAAAKAGDQPRARQLLQEAVAHDPRSEAAWLWLASVAESPQEALTHLETVLALNPSHERALAAIRPVRLQAGIAAARANDRDLARTILERVVENDPASEVGWMWLASVAESPDSAVSCLEKVLALNPANDKARAGLERYRAASAAPVPSPVQPEKPRAIPRVSSAARPTTAPTEPTRPRSEKLRQPVGTILVVDDSPTLRKLVSLTVERRGFRAHAAADGTEAIQMIRDLGVPDLILLDVDLPGMDGYQLCRLLRHNADTGRVPIVLLASKDGFFHKMRGRLVGSDHSLAKPFEPEALLRVVEHFCRAEDGSSLATAATE